MASYILSITRDDGEQVDVDVELDCLDLSNRKDQEKLAVAVQNAMDELE